MLLFLNVIYVLIAIAMVALILMQRGAGAQAGSGFGGGASSTVFGSRGASNFLSKSTKWLAIVFFAISLFMAWQATQRATGGDTFQDLGVMSQAPAEAVPAGEIPVQGSDPAVPTVPVDAAPAPAADSAVPSVPAAPQQAEPPPSDASGS